MPQAAAKRILGGRGSADRDELNTARAAQLKKRQSGLPGLGQRHRRVQQVETEVVDVVEAGVRQHNHGAPSLDIQSPESSNILQ